MIRRRYAWERVTLILGLIVQPILLAATLSAQVPAGPAISTNESVSDLVNKLTPEQKTQFTGARQAYQARRYTDAAATFKLLLRQFPGDAILSKYATEAALNGGDVDFALKTIKPVAQANPEDFQATALLTRACAESSDTPCRDAGVAHMLDLHRRGLTPSRMEDYVVEHVKADGNTVIIFTSLEPWGEYKIYNTATVLDGDGKLFMTITLESSDGDQVLFAKEHPKEAAQGLRSFSLDAYRETGLNGNGQRTQTHYTYKFLVGQPSYDTVREAFLDIANGRSKPMSIRGNLVVP
jgi:hypothetical protein